MNGLKKVFLIFFFVFIFFSCSKGNSGLGEVTVLEPSEGKDLTDAAVITDSVELSSVKVPQSREGMITFISGTVMRLEGGAWIYAEIGEPLEENDSIQVESDSYCEIQFSDRAVIRVEENTQLALNTINLDPQGSKVGIELITGMVICKVQKLADNDRFNVKTPSVACGVRGTQFSVKSEPGKNTVLAVKEGAVAILPPELVVESLVVRAGKSGDKVAEVLEKIETAAFVVGANRQVSLTEDTFRETDKTVQQITEIIDRIEASDSKSLEEVSPEVVGSLLAASDTITKIIAEPEVQTDEISAINSAALKKTEVMRMVSLPVVKISEAENNEKEETTPNEINDGITLRKFSVKVVPSDAEIILNSKTVGKGSFSGVFEDGEILNLEFISDNFETQSTSFTISEKTSKQYTITLEQSETELETKSEEDVILVKEDELPAVSTEEQVSGDNVDSIKKEESIKQEIITEEVSPEKSSVSEAPAPIVKELIDVRVNIEPLDSTLLINGAKVQTGIFTGKFPEGTSIKVEGSRNGFKDKSVLLKVGERGSNNLTISLEPHPVESIISVSPSKLVGSLSTGAGMVYASDSHGKVSAVTPDGRFIWSIDTGNKTVENSFPVFSNNRIYFSGSSDFVIINALDGNLIKREILDKNSAHIFGRRVVPFGSKSLFPANNEIRIIDSNSGEFIKAVSLSQNGSRMTPAVWENKILSVDQNGTLSIINIENGNIENEIKTHSSQPIALAITIKDNIALYSGRKGDVVCIDLQAKRVLWETRLSSSGNKLQVYTDIVCSATGAFIYSKGRIYSLSLRSGEKLYDTITNVSAPPLYVGNSLVFGDNDQNLLFMNPENGGITKKLQLGHTVSVQPVEIDKRIAVGTTDGNILIINPEGIR